MVVLGRLALVVALIAAATTTVCSWAASTGRRVPVPTALARRMPALTFAALAAAFAVLEVALVSDDFSVRFVAEHHRASTPLLYTLTGAWAGLEGSLLLWTLVIGAYLYVVSRRVGDDDGLGRGAMAVMGSVAVVFVGIVLFVAPTFVGVTERSEGFGANPLLQDNVMMAIHPPLLYLGYVGFLVPFSFAVAALWRRERGPRWVLRTQTWAVVAWSFLTIGILIGGWWSYEVLGWGGYWAWDPVENASFLPWLVGTAYLHSAVMQARRGMLPAWSVGLVLSTFVLTLLGTFLARSGVIASVHAFSGSALGPVLLAYLVVVVGVVGWLFATRLRDVVVGPPLQSLASREGAFLLNNLLLGVFAAVVLVGTVYPIVVEALTDERISVGRPFFDRFAVVITLALLLALLIGAVAPHRRATWRVVWTALRLPVQIGLGAAALCVAVFGLRAPYVIVVVALAGAIVASGVVQLAGAARDRRDGRGLAAAVAGALRARPGHWGGQVAHAGLAILTLGIAASSNLADRATVTLSPGDSVTAAGYTITYAAPTSGRSATYEARGVELLLSRDGMVHALTPEFHQYPNQVQPVGVPDVWTTVRGDDAYVALLRLDEQAATIQVYRYPWLFLVWTGGIVMTAGGAFGLLLRGARRRSDRRVLAVLDESGVGVEDVVAT